MSGDAPTRQVVVAGLVVDDAGRVLAARRSRPPALAGRWEFPGGKVEPDESPEQALGRELREELGIGAVVGAELPGPDDGCWPIDDRLVMRAYWCVGGHDAAPGEAHDQVVWLAPDELAGVAWLPADVALAATVAAHLLGDPPRAGDVGWGS